MFGSNLGYLNCRTIRRASGARYQRVTTYSVKTPHAWNPGASAGRNSSHRVRVSYNMCIYVYIYIHKYIYIIVYIYISVVHEYIPEKETSIQKMKIPEHHLPDPIGWGLLWVSMLAFGIWWTTEEWPGLNQILAGKNLCLLLKVIKQMHSCSDGYILYAIYYRLYTRH